MIITDLSPASFETEAGNQIIWRTIRIRIHQSLTTLHSVINGAQAKKKFRSKKKQAAAAAAPVSLMCLTDVYEKGEKVLKAYPQSLSSY